ncbi:MAG: hypothetical protein ACXVAY_10780 [Mucilaginibacter sp.]|jgi:hypothetical protein
MAVKTVEFRAKEYVYDLNNCASEYGFKADESWELSLATDVEKIAIEKKYYPTVSAKVLPETLLELFRLVKGKLVAAKSEMEKKFDSASQNTNTNLQYIIAYNPKRTR